MNKERGDCMNPLADVQLYLLDMDGTFYLDGVLLPGALEFLDKVRQTGKQYLFVTNNSSKNINTYWEKLNRLGAKVEKEDFLGSADATVMYLKKYYEFTDILLIGTKDLEQQFINAGYCLNPQNPKAVVLGFDTTIDYHKLTMLCNAVRAGLPYIATHPDLNCPVKDGFIPDIGAVIAFVKAATGREPDVVVGKPNPWIALAAAQKANCNIEQLCMVGDRLYTDIALGQNCNLKTALVLCGETTPEQAKTSEIKATVTVQNLKELIQYL